VTAANARLRYAIAADQFTRELEAMFALRHRDSGYTPNMPTPRMVFWNDIMAAMLAEGWASIVR